MKPILFCDFDGTICHDRYWRSLPSGQYEKVQALLFRGDTTRVNDWMRGVYTAEEINRHVATEVGLRYEELWSLFVNDCNTMYVPQNVLDKISTLRDRYTVILITGNMDSFTRFTVPALKLEHYFDHISNSYYEGRSKTDDNGEIFVDYAQKWNASLSDCVVVDDNPKVCSTFEALGERVCMVNSDKNVRLYLDTL